ncbi:MAG: hypothetical protein HC908_01625 [Calothrix sp. SM1_7_51]|nr:hypothetical protein [Calothrix sp. SM1_7_51]
MVYLSPQDFESVVTNNKLFPTDRQEREVWRGRNLKLIKVGCSATKRKNVLKRRLRNVVGEMAYFEYLRNGI